MIQARITVEGKLVEKVIYGVPKHLPHTHILNQFRRETVILKRELGSPPSHKIKLKRRQGPLNRMHLDTNTRLFLPNSQSLVHTRRHG